MVTQRHNYRLFTNTANFFPAMVSGILLTLCFPDASFSWLAYVALVPWLIAIRRMPPKTAFVSGVVMGMTHYLTLIYWLCITLQNFGGLPFVLAAATLVLLSAYLSLYPAFFAVFQKKAGLNHPAGLILETFAWVSLEYIRTYAFTGFPWGIIGYSQFAHLPVIQIADIAGVYGVSALIALINLTMVRVVIAFRDKNFACIWPAALISGLSLAIVLTYGYVRIGDIDTRIAASPTSPISIIQGNIRQDVKWDAAYKTGTLDKYLQMSFKALSTTEPLSAPETIPDTKPLVPKAPPDLIIWPETALPFYYGPKEDLSKTLDEAVKTAGASFLIGSPAYEIRDKEIMYFNRAYMFNPKGLITGHFDKTHLVPFGEYVPLGKYLKFLGKITAQAGDFTGGPKSFFPLRFDTHNTGILICFEILFPTISATFVENGADLLTTITNDAWFGQSSAAMQHFSIAVFRAVENRRSVARAANTGISGFIEPTGHIVKTTALFSDAVISHKVPCLSGISLYTRHKDMFARGCLVAIILFFMVKGVKKKLRRKQNEHRI